MLTQYDTNDNIALMKHKKFIEYIDGGHKLDSKKIAEKLIGLRTEKGLTQQQLADFLGISVSAVTNYELGIRIPRDEIKIRYAKFFNRSVSDIFLISMSQFDTIRRSQDAQS